MSSVTICHSHGIREETILLEHIRGDCPRYISKDSAKYPPLCVNGRFCKIDECSKTHLIWDDLDVLCVGWCQLKNGPFTMKVCPLTMDTYVIMCQGCNKNNLASAHYVVCTNVVSDNTISQRLWKKAVYEFRVCDLAQEKACVQFAFFRFIVGCRMLELEHKPCRLPLLRLANKILEGIPREHFDDVAAHAKFVSELALEDVFGLMVATFTEDLKSASMLSAERLCNYTHFKNPYIGEMATYQSKSGQKVADSAVKDFFPKKHEADLFETTTKHLRNISSHLNYVVISDSVPICEPFYKLLILYLDPLLFKGNEDERNWPFLRVDIEDKIVNVDPSTIPPTYSVTTTFKRINLSPYKLYCACRKFHKAVDEAAGLW